MFHEKFDNWNRKMDLYLTTSASTFPCFQINWFVYNFLYHVLDHAMFAQANLGLVLVLNVS